jgi:hypothetical protein
MNEYERKGSRIVIDDGPTKRAIFKVQPLSDGGYAVLAPYHAAREGWLARTHVDYTKTNQTLRFEDLEHFTADDRVKLSHHADGFVQFSGENPGKILSGRDPVSGEPKGLAVQSAPIGLPITTGPTFGGTVWGLDQFRELNKLRSSDLDFPPDAIYYRGCRPDTCNAFLLEGWVFWPPMWAGVSGSEYDLRLSIGFRNFEGSGANLTFRVIPLAGNNCFLGISVHRVRVSFPGASGFAINGPSDRLKASTEGNALMALYPRDDILNTQPSITLNYQAPVQPPSDPAMLGEHESDAKGADEDLPTP